MKMAKIVNVCREHIPAVRFIGKRYTDNDRVDGGFGYLWGEWFQNGWFDKLEALNQIEGIENGYMGFMRCYPDFDYWIGMLLPPDTEVPEGYSYFNIPAGDVGVCWIQGNEDDGSIYNMHGVCLDTLRKKGMGEFKIDETSRAFFFERYNCPRFTSPDKNGNIILDYGIYLA